MMTEHTTETVTILTDAEILEKADPIVRPRRVIELAIVDKLVECANSAGYRLEVWPTGHWCEYSAGPYDVKSALFNLDDAQVMIFDAASEERLGWVSLIFGSSGYDLISDYTVGIEGFLRPVLDFAESFDK